MSVGNGLNVVEFKDLSEFLTVPPSKWLERSELLRDAVMQRRIDEYFRKSEIP